MVNTDLDCTLIESLQNPGCYPHPLERVRLLETHISWVLLAGEFVYKIKKPVDFGFLDFSELHKRRFYCQEELRLNGRLAPGLYIDVISIGGSAKHPVLGAEPAIEYAVKMRRFAEDDLLDHILAQGRLTSSHMESLAEIMANFHATLPSAAEDAGYGDAAAVAQPARQNFEQLAKLLQHNDSESLAELEAASEAEFARCVSLFDQRLQQGWVRECHGDLHLGNIVMLNDQPTPFDGIEFNPALRWIDTINDIAFLQMDLQQRGHQDLAYAFLNAYCQTSGDYAGLAVLRFYLAYRALVMAKVTAIRAVQQGKQAASELCMGYLALAEHYFRPTKPVLMITHGLPGCGKTTVSQIVLEKYQAIRIRSDVERKRLFGLQAHQSSSDLAGTDIYSQEATERTYRQLLALSKNILQRGFSVIVDAAFLQQRERAMFQALADSMCLPFAILNISGDAGLQRQRIRQRLHEGSDASEADVVVYEMLNANRQPLTTAESQISLNIRNDDSIERLRSNKELWSNLDRLINVD